MIKIDEFILDAWDSNSYAVYKPCTRKKEDGTTYDDKEDVGYHSHFSSAVHDLINRLILKKLLKEADNLKVLLEEMKRIEISIKSQLEGFEKTIIKKKKLLLVKQ